MRKTFSICLILLLSIIMLSGCHNMTFDITRVGNNSTVKIHEAQNDDFAITDYFSVGKNQIVVVESQLTSGQLKIEFREAVVTSDDVYERDIVATVIVSGSERTEVPLGKGNYIMWLTSVGTTDGTVKITVEKK